mmetsp:Transcript_6340/g.9493  ORF Transcript_6340/g.9493 Transcript_6340/m.9493 type:complete len:295 (+) Transcript_6340:426-1310(+)
MQLPPQIPQRYVRLLRKENRIRLACPFDRPFAVVPQAADGSHEGTFSAPAWTENQQIFPLFQLKRKVSAHVDSSVRRVKRQIRNFEADVTFRRQTVRNLLALNRLKALHFTQNLRVPTICTNFEFLRVFDIFQALEQIMQPFSLRPDAGQGLDVLCQNTQTALDDAKSHGCLSDRSVFQFAAEIPVSNDQVRQNHCQVREIVLKHIELGVRVKFLLAYVHHFPKQAFCATFFPFTPIVKGDLFSVFTDPHQTESKISFFLCTFESDVFEFVPENSDCEESPHKRVGDHKQRQFQ